MDLLNGVVDRLMIMFPRQCLKPALRFAPANRQQHPPGIFLLGAAAATLRARVGLVGVDHKDVKGHIGLETATAAEDFETTQ